MLPNLIKKVTEYQNNIFRVGGQLAIETCWSVSCCWIRLFSLCVNRIVTWANNSHLYSYFHLTEHLPLILSSVWLWADALHILLDKAKIQSLINRLVLFKTCNLFQASSLTVSHSWQDSAFTKGCPVESRGSMNSLWVYVHATKKPEFLYVEGVFVKSSSSFFLRVSSVMWICFRHGFSALLWYQHSVPREIKTGLFYFPLK